MVLVKDGSDYHVGLYNGVYIQIIRSNVDIPKSQIEIELDKQREEHQKKLQELEISELGTKTDRELFLEKERKFRMTAFAEFKQKHGIPLDKTMEWVFAEMEHSSEVFEDFVIEKHDGMEGNVDEYVDANDMET